jgi:hypothetical protein
MNSTGVSTIGRLTALPPEQRASALLWSSALIEASEPATGIWPP